MSTGLDFGVAIFNEASPVSVFCTHLLHYFLIGLIKGRAAYSRAGLQGRDRKSGKESEMWEIYHSGKRKKRVPGLKEKQLRSYVAEHRLE